MSATASSQHHRPRGRAAAALLAVLVAAGSPPARAQDRSLVPGRMGYNALPTVPNEDPVVGDEVLVELQLATQLSDFGAARDAAATPYGRLVVPFRGVAALEFDAVPVELWRVAPDTQRRLGAAATRGVELGDVRFGARFLILAEGEAWPALGVRVFTKTASGKGLESRRFTSAPGYLGDLLVGKDLAAWSGGAGRLRLLGKLGFLSWQQGDGWQDDGIDFGATLQLQTGAGSRVELEWRGYSGYERQDRPRLVGLTAAHLTGPVEWVATANRGIGTDAPPWEVRMGAILHLRSPWAGDERR